MTLINLDAEAEALLTSCHDSDRHEGLSATVAAALEVYNELENPEEMRPGSGTTTPGVGPVGSPENSGV